jgi:hypothetical protein
MSQTDRGSPDSFVEFSRRLDTIRTLKDFLSWQDDLRTSGLFANDAHAARADGWRPLSPRSIPVWARVLAMSDGEPSVISLPSGEIAIWDPCEKRWCRNHDAPATEGEL